jgi:hypothetical protein
VNIPLLPEASIGGRKKKVTRMAHNVSLLTAPVRLVTAADIARRLGQPVRRVRWVLATRLHLRPTAMAGPVRVYPVATVALVQDELDRIDDRRRKAARA